jgi:hypothetical protein
MRGDTTRRDATISQRNIVQCHRGSGGRTRERAAATHHAGWARKKIGQSCRHPCRILAQADGGEFVKFGGRTKAYGNLIREAAETG